MEWKTNARWGQEVTEGTIYTFKENEAIKIHKMCGLGNKWYLSCHCLNISQFGLNTDDFDLAVENAKVIVTEKLKLITEKIDRFRLDDSPNVFVRY